MAGLFATHPPIEERTARVRPGFQATRYRQGRQTDAPAEAAAIDTGFGAVAGFGGGSAPAADGNRVSDIGNAWGRSAADSARLGGTLDAGKVDYVSRLLAGRAPELRAARTEVGGAGAVRTQTVKS